MKISYVLIISIVFCMLSTSSLVNAQNLERYNWRPIKEITVQEVSIVEKASRRSAVAVLGRSTFFAVVLQTVMLYGQDSILRIYGINSGNLLSENRTPIVSVSDQSNSQSLGLPCSLEPICLDLSESLVEFIENWEKGNFRLADQFVLEYFAKLEQALKTNPSFVSNDKLLDLIYFDLRSIFARGNRYFGMADRYAELFGPSRAIRIYEGYLESYAALEFDQPSQADLINVLRKIGTLSDSVEFVILSEDTLKLVRLLVPEIYRKLDEKPKG